MLFLHYLFYCPLVSGQLYGNGVMAEMNRKPDVLAVTVVFFFGGTLLTATLQALI